MIGTNADEGQPRRGWFAETLVVVGILAFAYAAIMLQPQEAGPILDMTVTGSIR